VLYLALAIASTLFFFLTAAGVPTFEWLGSPATPQFYVSWAVFGTNSWCWTMVVFNVGMRFLNFTNRWLQYGRGVSYPFFLLHQPVIIAIAYYVVQWDISTVVKLPVVVVSSFCITLGLIELLVRPIRPIRWIFGVRPRKHREETKE
jgi:peptidoglycan/LPS O-acetylase OafA/YrhL